MTVLIAGFAMLGSVAVPASAAAGEASIVKASLAIFTAYDSDAGYPTGQCFPLKYALCGWGERMWVRYTQYADPTVRTTR
ncbi:MAG: hypothetical protein WCI34_06450 [Actinomycetes bacterium]